MSDLSPAALRLLRFLHAHPRWHSRIEIELHKVMLEPGDAACLPVLIAQEWAEPWPATDSVRITPAGRVLIAALA